MKLEFVNLFIDDSEDFTLPEKKKISLNDIVCDIYASSTGRGPWIAGGMGRQLAIGEIDFNDIDVWFDSLMQFEITKKYLEHKYEHAMYQNFVSDNAETYFIGDYKVQLIKRKWYPSIDSIFDDFDFTCCQIAVDSNLKIYGPGILDARNFILKLNKLDSHAFLARYGKYVSYGYVMDPEQFIKILETEKINYVFDGTVFGY
jgi:hypothetical protein